jgi:hypothetical protein
MTVLLQDLSDIKKDGLLEEPKPEKAVSLEKQQEQKGKLIRQEALEGLSKRKTGKVLYYKCVYGSRV